MKMTLAMGKLVTALCFLTGCATLRVVECTDRAIWSWGRNIFLGLASSCILYLWTTALLDRESARRGRAEASRQRTPADKQHRDALAGGRRRRVHHLAQTVGLTVLNGYTGPAPGVLPQDL